MFLSPKNKVVIFIFLLVLFLIPGYRMLTCVWDNLAQQIEKIQLPQPSFTAMVPMRDATKLATDVYLPKGDGPWPVILIRTPYDRTRYFKKNPLELDGYAMVIQDTRGRYDSEGTDVVYQSDGWGLYQDGYDTCSWIVSQPWSNGKIGTMGNSGLGITQALLAPTHPPGLVCQVIGFAPGDFYDDWAFPGNVPLSIWQQWLARQGAPWLYQESLMHFPRDDWWDQFNFIKAASRVSVPVLHISGWHDIWITGTIRRFQAWQHQGGTGAGGSQRLVVGPWTHEATDAVVGCEEYNAAALPKWDMLIPRFFDYWLKGEKNGFNEDPVLMYWEMSPPDTCNENGWRRTARFPQVESKALYMDDQMTLISHIPAASSKYSFVYNPQNPWATTGGRTLLGNAGPQEVSKELKKNHHVLFMTAPLEEALTITGEIQCLLYLDITAPCADVAAIILDILPDGRTIMLADGIRRLRFGEDASPALPLSHPGESVSVSLGWTSYRFPPRHRIGLVITGGNWPLYDKNPQNGKMHYTEDSAQDAAYSIFSGGNQPSSLLLPVAVPEPA